MPYVITGTCTKDEHCIETCPANCIHPTKDEPDFATAAQLYVNPTECIDCVVRASRSARLPRFSIWRNCRRNCRNLFKRKPLTLTKRPARKLTARPVAVSFPFWSAAARRRFYAMTLPNDPMESVRKVRSRGGHDFSGGGVTIRCHPEPSAGSAFRKMPRKKKIPHSADSVWNDKRRVFPQPVQSCHMCLPCNPALAAEDFGSWFSHRLHGGAPARRSQKRC